MSPGGRVAIVGAGWAGLACAVELAAAGIRVLVFEAARQPGGRARAVEFGERRLDNGQHLLVGAYRETLRVMRLAGATPEHAFARTPLHLDYSAFSLRLPRLPAPLHAAVGLFAARGATWSEKLAAVRFMRQLQRRHYRLPADTAVADWLDAEGQHGALRRHLWDALCLAALNTAPALASAQVFANVLRDSLGGGRDAADMLLPHGDLGRLFPEPALHFIAARGGEVRLSTRVDALQRDGDDWSIVVGERTERCTQVVLAVAPQHLSPLLATRTAHAPLLAQLAGYAYEPIATAYLAYPPDVRLASPMLGLSGGLGQWVFDRGQAGGNPGTLAFVLSANGAWDDLGDDALCAALHKELAAVVGPLPPPHWQRVIRERRASFSCRPGLPRPGTHTAERGLWLAGDYTWAEYPATLEGAVRSGVAAARAVLADLPPASDSTT